MKKMILVLVLCMLCTLMAGCSSDNGAATKPAVTAEPAATAEQSATEAPEKVDLDLSGMSGTMIYSQIYNLMCDPEPYMGKIIKMSGYYTSFPDTERGIVYHACFLPDATACCTQGIEFVRPDGYSWPEDYPEENTEIVVSGCLESYEEDGQIYLHLTNAELTWQKDQEKNL